MTEPSEWDVLDLLPEDADAVGGEQPEPGEWDTEGGVLGGGAFLYDGRNLTLAEFEAFVEVYDFGSIPPDYFVLHHTAIPSATWAPTGTGAVWDANEAGLTLPQIAAKRRRQLDAIRNFYEKPVEQGGRGWDRGPHLFFDEYWIWLFSPMREIGIHAGKGNSTRVKGKLHYSIGGEVIGNFGRHRYPKALARNVGGAIRALHRRLQFQIAYRVGPGAIAGHRDYDPVHKAKCPGDAITPEYLIEIVLEPPPPPPPPAPVEVLPPGTHPVHPSFRAAWEASGGVWQKDRLTPGYAVLPAATSARSGRFEQVFERGVARLNPDGSIGWLRLDEL